MASRLWSFCRQLLLGTLFLVAVHQVLSVPVGGNPKQQNKPTVNFSDPVWSHGEAYSFASASGEGSMVETDSWTSIDNHGGLQVNNVTSNGTVIGYQVSGLTNCSQESWANAVGAWSANAVAHGLCNSSVLVTDPVSNTGVGTGTSGQNNNKTSSTPDAE